MSLQVILHIATIQILKRITMTGINQFHLLLSYFYEVASSENKTQSQSHDLIGPDNDIYLLFQLHFLPLNFSHFILLLSSIC